MSERSSMERTLASMIASSINQALLPFSQKVIELERRQEALESYYKKLSDEIITRIIQSSLTVAMDKATLDIKNQFDALSNQIAKLSLSVENLQRSVPSESAIEEIRREVAEIKSKVNELENKEIALDESAVSSIVENTLRQSLSEFNEKIETIDKKIEGLISKEAFSKILGSSLSMFQDNLTASITQTIKPDVDEMKAKLVNINRFVEYDIRQSLEAIRADMATLKAEQGAQKKKGGVEIEEGGEETA
ncbi:MAG: hypothetical protein ACP5IT_07870 [Thermoproteota archaeon]